MAPAPCFKQTVVVELLLCLTRPGWESPNVWGEVETEHELRAEVTLYGRVFGSAAYPDPDVEWLEKAAVEDLKLSRAEEKAAERQAIGAALDLLSKRAQENVELNDAIDAETARWKEQREMARAG
jgi:hypothetical protein